MRDPLPTPWRVAIYYASNPESDEWRLGSAWLGRCAHSDRATTQPRINGIAPDTFSALTADPAHYGWHATLKAPFRLAPGVELDTLRAEIQRFCKGRVPFSLGRLTITQPGRFLALTPAQAAPEIDRLAAACVQHFQPLAAPLTPAELARRRAAGLSPTQDALLQRWGYPYVLEEFRFHFSLTGCVRSVSSDTLNALAMAGEKHFRPLSTIRVDRLSIFIQPTPDSPFRLLEQTGFQP